MFFLDFVCQNDSFQLSPDSPVIIVHDPELCNLKCRRWVLAVQPPAAHPGRGAGPSQPLVEFDGLDLPGELDRGRQLQEDDVVGEGPMRPKGPTWAPNTPVIKGCGMCVRVFFSSTDRKRP